MKKLFTLMVLALYSFTSYAQGDPGSILAPGNSIDGKIYYDKAPGQVTEETAASGYDNFYYTWEYGVAGEEMTIATVTYDNGYPLDADNDGVQDTDTNGNLLYYDTASFLNNNSTFGELFGGKTVTFTRFANDVDGLLDQTSTSVTVDVLLEKRPVGGKIVTTQNNIRETAVIEAIASETAASEGYGALTYRWTIATTVTGSVETDLEISTENCDFAGKTFADYGFGLGDNVKITRYATDELGTEVLAQVRIQILASVAFEEPAAVYTVSASITGSSFAADFKLINGESENEEATNVGVKLVVAKVGGFRGYNAIVAQFGPEVRMMVPSNISEANVPYTKGDTYDVKYKIDPVNHTYSLWVKNSADADFVNLAQDSLYFSVDGGVTNNNIAFTHYDSKDFTVENFSASEITAGSIKAPANSVDGKLYFDKAPGQVGEETAAYASSYYTWGYGVAGEEMTIATVTYDNGYPLDLDNDGNQDTDTNGTLLYYNNAPFLNNTTIFGDAFGGKTVTFTRFANDKDGIFDQLSTSTTVEVLMEKSPVGGKIVTTQNNVRETAVIEAIASETAASEGFGTLTYSWTIASSVTGSVETDLGISTADCDLAGKTFVDYGFGLGDNVKITRYATDELGTKVLSQVRIQMLASVAFVEPSTPYEITASITGSSFAGNFKLINGESESEDATNIGVKLAVTKVGGFRGYNAIVAQYGPETRFGAPSNISVANVPYTMGDKYDIKYTIDPVNHTYSLLVKNSADAEFVTIIQDTTYFSVDGGLTNNNIAFTHYDSKDFKVEKFRVTPLAIAIDNVPTDRPYKLSATISGAAKSSFRLLNGESVNEEASNLVSGLFYDIGTGATIKLSTAKGLRMYESISTGIKYSADAKYDIEYTIDPITHTFTFKIRENGTEDFIVVYSDVDKTNPEFTLFNGNEVALTHYLYGGDTKIENLVVEACATEDNIDYSADATDWKYELAATVTPRVSRAGLFLVEGAGLPDFRNFSNFGPNVQFNTEGKISTIAQIDMSGNRPQIIEAGVDYAYELHTSYDFVFIVDAVNFTYTVKVKQGTEDETAFVTLVEDQKYFINGANASELVLSHVYYRDMSFDNLAVTPLFPSEDATLSDITFGGVNVEGFDSAVFDYDVELEEGTTAVPEVVGISTDENSTVVVTPAAEFPGTTTVVVTAEDGETVLTYTVNFTVTLGLNDSDVKIGVYPNPTTGLITIDANSEISFIELYSISGSLVKVIEANATKSQFNISGLKAGIYFAKVNSEEGVSITRIIKE
ncbi:MAG: T9SS type A sorting domain-containing protein [Bacteroidota bacterium]